MYPTSFMTVSPRASTDKPLPLTTLMPNSIPSNRFLVIAGHLGSFEFVKIQNIVVAPFCSTPTFIYIKSKNLSVESGDLLARRHKKRQIKLLNLWSMHSYKCQSHILEKCIDHKFSYFICLLLCLRANRSPLSTNRFFWFNLYAFFMLK